MLRFESETVRTPLPGAPRTAIRCTSHRARPPPFPLPPASALSPSPSPPSPPSPSLSLSPSAPAPFASADAAAAVVTGAEAPRTSAAQATKTRFLTCVHRQPGRGRKVRALMLSVREECEQARAVNDAGFSMDIASGKAAYRLGGPGLVQAVCVHLPQEGAGDERKRPATLQRWESNETAQ